MTFSLYCRFCGAHHTRLGADQTPDDSYMCERCAYAYEEGRAELDAHRDAANVLTEELQDAHQARELAERRTARWKALAKRYRGDAADWRAAFEAAAAMHAGALAAELVGRVVEPSPRCPECNGPTSSAAAPPFCSWRCKRSGEGWSANLLSPEGSARVSSSASGFPGRAAPACKERDNMSGNNGMGGTVVRGAEGGT